MIYDAVVIGGGPAGAAAAIGLARAGRQVVVLESARFPRAKPGETLHPGVEPLLRQLGVDGSVLAAGFLRPPGLRVCWDGPETYEAYGADEHGPWLGFQAVREVFDGLLLDAARAAGAELRQPCRALGVTLHDADGVASVLTDAGEFATRFVIDAAGPSHWLARRLRLAVERCSPPLQLRYGWRQLKRAPDFFVPRLRAERGGWTWLAQTGKERVAWARLRFGRGIIPAPIELRGGGVIGHDAGADGTWRAVAPCAGHGWFAIGDAAAVLDPSSSHGILRALMTGMQAAHLINAVFRSVATPEEVAGHYREWLHDWFAHDHERMSEFYRRHPHGF